MQCYGMSVCHPIVLPSRGDAPSGSFQHKSEVQASLPMKLDTIFGAECQGQGVGRRHSSTGNPRSKRACLCESLFVFLLFLILK